MSGLSGKLFERCALHELIFHKSKHCSVPCPSFSASSSATYCMQQSLFTGNYILNQSKCILNMHVVNCCLIHSFSTQDNQIDVNLYVSTNNNLPVEHDEGCNKLSANQGLVFQCIFFRGVKSICPYLYKTSVNVLSLQINVLFI